MERKTEQLQFRLSPAEKLAIQNAAERNGRSVTEWILSQLLPETASDIQQAISETNEMDTRSFAFADLHDALAAIDSKAAFEQTMMHAFALPDDDYLRNYIAAMIEHRAQQLSARSPEWLKNILPLSKPHFGESLKSLRMHLLRNSPIAFRARNIFIDASVGARV